MNNKFLFIVYERGLEPRDENILEEGDLFIYFKDSILRLI